jgi:hypothetical protein
MIVSASYRTDIPAFYGRWFRARLAAGFCLTVNPYGGRVSRVDLRPQAVDGFVFWTRNILPFRNALDDVDAGRIPFVVHHTITGLPRALERSVIEPERSVAAVREIAGRWGPKAVVWRYDPIVFTSVTPPDWHRAAFARLAEALAGAVDEVVVSFLQPYRKTIRNLDRAARDNGFSWRTPEVGEKRALLADLAAIAAGHGLRLTTCTQPDLADVPGVSAARCVDAERLSAVAGRAIRARTKGNRPGCLCAESRDIGDYDTCPHGCAYCYAVDDPARAKTRYRAHDPDGPSLFPLPPPDETDLLL